MSALSKRAAEVEAELGAAWTRYHVGAQVARFLGGVLVTLLLSLHNGFSDWTDLLPLVAGAAWTTAAQMWPQVPWSLLKDRFTPAPKYATGGYIPGSVGATAKTYPGPSSAPKTVGDVLSGGASPTTTDPAPPPAPADKPGAAP